MVAQPKCCISLRMLMLFRRDFSGRKYIALWIHSSYLFWQTLLRRASWIWWRKFFRNLNLKNFEWPLTTLLLFFARTNWQADGGPTTLWMPSYDTIMVWGKFSLHNSAADCEDGVCRIFTLIVPSISCALVNRGLFPFYIYWSSRDGPNVFCFWLCLTIYIE